jgi:hypothetical protein
MIHDDVHLTIATAIYTPILAVMADNPLAVFALALLLINLLLSAIVNFRLVFKRKDSKRKLD